MTDDLYPPAPDGVPRDLTAPSAAYKRHTWLAFGGLVLFVALYVGLTGYFGWLVYRLLRDAFTGGQAILGVLLSLPPAFFFAFLVRGLFVVKHREDPTLVEVTAEDEPALLAFLHRVADDAGAPRPHRVFLSARVNAAVFYDLSFRNLLFPSKKNLEIGLGLVNTLSLDELKAVVAHEFGHFAQRTMAVGRWVYLAQQIAGHVIVSRGWFDNALAWISSIDLRVAWIGWIFRLLVWAIRAVLDTFFRVIVLAHRALTREMELQADLVAVSLSGSDSLIHALHRLGPADDAWDRAIRFAGAENARKKRLTDLFAAQSRVLDHLRTVFDDETLGRSPERPKIERESHRVFEAALAQPPRMWSTHPPNRDREDNAKARYFPSRFDARPAWSLFADPEATRRRVTEAFAEVAFSLVEGAEAAPLDEAMARLDEDFERPILDRRYRGAYLNRSVVACARAADELFDPLGSTEDRAAALARIDALYPDSLSADLERHRELLGEQTMLQALMDGVLDAPGGVIRYRGEEIPRKRVGEVIERLRGEVREAEDAVLRHDRACRTAHRAAAALLDPAWEAYLVSLSELLHYADHASANLRDAHDYMHHVLGIVLADGRVTSGERARLQRAAHDVWEPLAQVFGQRPEVVLPAAVAEELEKDTWQDILSGPFDFPTPHPDNLGDWLQASDSWAFSAADALGVLASATLEVLLEAEDHVASCLRDERDPGEAPAPAEVPAEYTTMVIGEERERQKRLGWWDRFQLADGFFPGAARFAVAAGMLVPALMLGGSVGDSTVTIYNGLGVPVTVSIDGAETYVSPRSSRSVDVPTADDVAVVATGPEGRPIERFEADVEHAWADYVYNVAGAGALLEWTAVYGSRTAPPDRRLGAPRWLETDADVLFREPPNSVSTSSGSSGTTRDVLSAVHDLPPAAQLSVVEDADERRRLLEAHLRWDPNTDPSLGMWVAAATAELGDALPALLEARASAGEGRVLWARMLQDSGDEAAHAAACARDRAAAQVAPDDPDAVYLAIRCDEDLRASGEAFLGAHARHPNHPWLTMAAAYEHARRGEWEAASPLFDRVRSMPALAPLWPGVAVDAARVRRVLAPSPSRAVLSDLTDGAPGLATLVAFERGEEPDPTFAARLRPWRLIADGRPSEAVAAADAAVRGGTLDAAGASAVLRLAATSTGAPPALVSRALAEPPASATGSISAWPMVALALREGHDPAQWIIAATSASGHEAAPLLDLLDVAALEADPLARMESVTSQLSPSLRGAALVMGVMLMGPNAPDTWRRDARALLFTAERPNL